MLAFATGKDLYLGISDGSNSRKLAALPFPAARSLSWSPDRKRLHFILGETEGNRQIDRLWELKLGEDKCRKLLPGWSPSPADQEGGGQWTPDGRFFIFTAIHDGISAIWSISERHDVFAPGVNTPAQLTAVPGGVSGIAASPDGKRIYAAITLPQRGEVVRLEPGTGQFVTYPQMRGISAGQLAFSPDGNQVAYMGYPDERLWKMNSDGTNRQSLSERGALPLWSPDGRLIAFMGWDRLNDGTTIRLISPAGGPIQQPVSWHGWQGAPNWTRDGNQLVFGENGPVNPIPASCRLHAFDFRSGRTTDLPGTAGLWTARTSPVTDRYVAAMTNDNRKLVLYDRRTASLTELLSSADGPLGDNPVWSKDGKFIYMDVSFAREPAVYRIRVADRKIELVASLRGLRRTTASVGLWIGLTPDGSLLTLRELQGSEIYSWDILSP
jgi:Tol biopolymer transport system component